MDAPNRLRDTNTDTIFRSALSLAASVPKLKMCRAVLHERLLTLPPLEVAKLLERLARSTIQTTTESHQAMLATSLALIELRYGNTLPIAPRPDDLSRDLALLERIHEAANGEALAIAAMLTEDLAPSRILPPLGRLAEVCITPELVKRVANLDHRFLALYRRPRLAKHHDPVAIRHVLTASKRWTPQQLAMIACRRPTTLPIVLELVRNMTSILHPLVRQAIVQNPYTPTPIALALAPTLRRADLQKTRGLKTLHPRVCLLVEALLDPEWRAIPSAM